HRDKDIDPDSAHEHCRVNTNSFDPEAARHVHHDVEPEHSAAAQIEAFVQVDNQRSTSEVPQQLVEERRVEGGELFKADRAEAGINLESPWQVSGAAEQLLIEIVAHAPDCLSDQNPGSRSVCKGHEGDA